MITGAWSQPRIYPDMAGMLDNPDAAYAKLREMGKGLFGPDGAGLGNILNSFGLGGAAAPGSGNATGSANPQTQQQGQGQNNPLGGQLGEAIGNLIQQGLSSGAGNGTGRSRGLPGASTTPAPQASPTPPTQDPPEAQQDSQPMNDVMRQLFNR
jgi:AsmA protein